MSSAVNSAGTLNKIHHVFMVSFPGQGHINPLLRLAKRLARLGLFVTLCAPVCMSLSIRRANESITGDEFIPVGRGMIRFEFFDDGSEVGKFGGSHDLDSYLPQLEQAGREKLPQMIKKHEEEGQPVCCLINNPFIPWVSDVAESLGIPCAMLWVQSCACFSAYYHYHHNLVSFPSESEPVIDVRLPCMPVLKHDEVPSFLHPSTPYASLRSVILAQFKNLSKSFCILMDTLHELEPENIEYMSKLICRPIRTIGPLFKELENSGCIDSSNSNSDAVRIDILAADNCLDWLDSKPSGSVVYISFGTVVHLKQEQVDEFAYGILGAGVSFLWVLRPPPKESNVEPLVLPQGFLDGVGDKGKIVQWSPQEEVLAHPAIACFLTHCGWNSTLEALASGVPLVAFPFWGDQVTNAKFLIDEFGVGIRMSRGEADSRIIPREEVERCLRAATSGPEVAEMKANALKWKKAAEEAVAVGGSSFVNMQEFVEEVISIGSG